MTVLNFIALSAALALAVSRGAVLSAQDESLSVAESLRQLASGDEDAYQKARKSLNAAGTKAIVPLMLFTQSHLADKDEALWKRAYSAFEQIIKEHRFDPDLDSDLVGLIAPDTKNATFGDVDFVWIPEGWFVAGSSIAPTTRRFPDEYKGEVRRVWTTGFWISRTEVTKTNWRREGIAGGLVWEVLDFDLCPAPLNISPSVLTENLEEFLKGFSKRVRPYGLAVEVPSPEQWEKAARGTDGRLYPWGNSLLRILDKIPEICCNSLYGGPRPDKLPEALGRPRPVASCPIDTSPFGVKDMVGNVAELVRTPVGEIQIRGCGFQLDSMGEPMVSCRTKGFPVGFRIVLIPLDSYSPKDGKLKN